MEIGRKLRELREDKNLSQGDIEQKTGLLRCYTSRVENGYTVPSVGTLVKYARALDVPLYRFFTDGEPVRALHLPKSGDRSQWGEKGKERRELQQFAKALSRMKPRSQKLLFAMAQRMATPSPQA
ncbi:MAG: helix-turn-helix transcriptional regulator [Candidatus Acidiferrales bacterium]|jgi:transcriptional regulator with XRE-family HTH domain